MNNDLLLTRLFSQKMLAKLFLDKTAHIFTEAVLQYIKNPEVENNRTLLHQIYHYLSENYRNEYFYQNTLLNKLVLEPNGLNITIALTQIPISKSKADLILINEQATVYEIKTELDSLARLKHQVNDYYKSFDRVCVVASEKHCHKLLKYLKDTSVGIYELTQDVKLRVHKEPQSSNVNLSHRILFQVLRKKESERIILEYYKKLPTVSPVFYYEACFKQFENIPIEMAYDFFLQQLKLRNKLFTKDLIDAPYELKSLLYFYQASQEEYQFLECFLQSNFNEYIE